MFCPYCNMWYAKNTAICTYCGKKGDLYDNSHVVLRKQQQIHPIRLSDLGEPPLVQWQQPLPHKTFIGTSRPDKEATICSPKRQFQISASPSTVQRSTQLIPYQDTLELRPVGHQSTLTLRLVPEQAIEHLLPPVGEAEEIIHVPAAYKPTRALIPRYRAISGFLSVIIVSLLLCAGAGYYAKTSGKLATLQQLYGSLTLKNMAAASPPVYLPDPPIETDKDRGPAYAIISSATTTNRINPANNFALQEVRIFHPDQVFYLTFGSQSPPTNGTISIKWYTNGKLYRTFHVATLKARSRPTSASVTMQYPQPAEGMVEIYWNEQLAQRLYFVVR